MMLVDHHFFMAMQLLDSALPSTREWWRRRIGMREEFVSDPRTVAEIVADQHLYAADASIFTRPGGIAVASVDTLVSREAIADWIAAAEEAGIDPL